MSTVHDSTSSSSEQLIRLLRESDSATRTLAAWTGLPIHLHIVSRNNDDRPADEECAELEVRQEEPIQRRVVRLLDASDRVLSEATATIVLDRVPDHTALALRDSEVPLGLLLTQLNARRHTLNVVRPEQSADSGKDYLFEITARMDVGGRPVALVHERYLTSVLS
jgi:chorismate-pyruvate lyase